MNPHHRPPSHARRLFLAGGAALAAAHALPAWAAERISIGTNPVGTFYYVLGGGLAYALDAWLSPAGHSVLGASTAVFVALGLASAFTWRRRAWSVLTRMQRAAPLVAGVALLAFTGAGGERTDLLAHLFGFAVGAIAGSALSLIRLPAPGDDRPQWWAAGVAAMVLCAAWAMALA